MLKFSNNLGDIVDQCISKAIKSGATDVEVAIKKNTSETVSFRHKKLDESDRAENIGLSLAAYINKKKQ